MFLEMIANTAAAAAATTGLSEQAKFTMQHLQYLFQALTYAGAFAAIGFAAMGSAYGCGTACAAAVGAWKKCYSQNKPAPFQLLVFAGAPLSQVIYGMIIMFVIMGKPDVTQAAWLSTCWSASSAVSRWGFPPYGRELPEPPRAMHSLKTARVLPIS